MKLSTTGVCSAHPESTGAAAHHDKSGSPYPRNDTTKATIAGEVYEIGYTDAVSPQRQNTNTEAVTSYDKSKQQPHANVPMSPWVD